MGDDFLEEQHLGGVSSGFPDVRKTREVIEHIDPPLQLPYKEGWVGHECPPRKEVDLYRVLEFNPDMVSHIKDVKVRDKALADLIRKAHRRLARKYHPDVPETGDPVRFRRMQGAYETLSDPEERRRYEQKRRIERRREVRCHADLAGTTPWQAESATLADFNICHRGVRPKPANGECFTHQELDVLAREHPVFYSMVKRYDVLVKKGEGKYRVGIVDVENKGQNILIMRGELTEDECSLLSSQHITYLQNVYDSVNGIKGSFQRTMLNKEINRQLKEFVEEYIGLWQSNGFIPLSLPVNLLMMMALRTDSQFSLEDWLKGGKPQEQIPGDFQEKFLAIRPQRLRFRLDSQRKGETDILLATRSIWKGNIAEMPGYLKKMLGSDILFMEATVDHLLYNREDRSPRYSAAVATLASRDQGFERPKYRNDEDGEYSKAVEETMSLVPTPLPGRRKTIY